MRVAGGVVDQDFPLRIIDSTDGTPETGVVAATGGLDFWYWRAGGLKVSLTEADLTNLNDAHADGSFKHISDGYYRVCWPDAAFAAGVSHVTLGGTVTGMVVVGMTVQIGDAPADVTKWLGTAPATPTVAGVPEVDVTHVGGDAQSAADLKSFVDNGYDPINGDVLANIQRWKNSTPSDLDGSGNLPGNLISIAGDDAKATNLGNEFGGTPYTGQYVRRANAQAGAAGSVTLDASASATDDLYNGLAVVIVSGTGAGQARLITDYAGVTRVASVTPNWIVNPASGSVFVLRSVTRQDIALWLGSAPNALQSGRVDSYIGAVAAGVIAAASFAANALDAVWSTAARTLTSGLNIVLAKGTGITGFNDLSATEVENAAWDAVLADHLDAGSTGNALNAAGSAGDPWSTALPGAYGAGTAGKIIGDNVNATIGSRATPAQVAAELVTAGVTAVVMARLDVAVSSRLATAGYTAPDNATIAAIHLAIVTEIAEILADTTELQGDLANGGRLDLLFDAIKAKTDGLPASPAAVGSQMTLAADSVNASALAASAVAEIRAALNQTAMVEGYAAPGVAPTMEQAMFMLISHLFERTFAGPTLTNQKLDGTTSMTFTLDDALTPTSQSRAT